MDHYSDCELDFAMSKFTFIYEEGETKVSYSFHNIYCPEIIEHFKQFVLGCGFVETSLIEGMKGVVEEYEQREERRQQNLTFRNAKSSLSA